MGGHAAARLRLHRAEDLRAREQRSPADEHSGAWLLD